MSLLNLYFSVLYNRANGDGKNGRFYPCFKAIAIISFLFALITFAIMGIIIFLFKISFVFTPQKSNIILFSLIIIYSILNIFLFVRKKKYLYLQEEFNKLELPNVKLLTTRTIAITVMIYIIAIIISVIVYA